MWICDTCGDPIEKASEGWLEWLSEGELENERRWGFHITHHPQCHQYDDKEKYGGPRKDMHLDSFVGERGLASLLALAARGADRVEIVRVIARLHLPGFEAEYSNDVDDEEPEKYSDLIDVLKTLSKK